MPRSVRNDGDLGQDIVPDVQLHILSGRANAAPRNDNIIEI